jgi:cytochrome P450 family 130
MSWSFDPYDGAQAQSAWSLLEEMRGAGPVVEIDRGMRYVTRYEPCRDVLRDPVTFTSSVGMKAPGVVVPPLDRTLGEMDGSQHTLARRIMVGSVTPRVVHAAEPFMRATAHALLDAAPTDLVPGFTVPLPNRVTTYLLGFPAEDADAIAGWAKELMESGFPATNRSARGEGFAAAFPEFAGYIDDRIAARRAELEAGRDDHPDEVLTRLIRVKELAPSQVRALMRNLITGGLTTTSQLLGNVIDLLITDQDAQALIRASEANVVSAIEESLRLAPPVLFVARGCDADAEIAGCPVATGTRVILGHASANRDEDVFDEPNAFRVGRANADAHLTFGYGVHVCPGAAVARAVARVGIGVLLERFPPGTLRAAPGYRFENVPTYFEVGPRKLPIER